MIKKFLLTSAALLSVTGAWADTVVEPAVTKGATIENDGVVYTITSNSLTASPSSETKKVVEYDGKGNITLYKTTENVNSYSGTLNVKASQVSDACTNTSITINNFVKEEKYNIDNGESGKATNTYTVSTQLASAAPYIEDCIGENPNINIVQGKGQPDADGNNTYYKYSSMLTTLVQKNDDYFYVKTIDGSITYYCEIQSIKVETKTTEDRNYNISYVATAIGTNFFNGKNIVTVNINNTQLATIEPGAFKNNSSFQTFVRNSNTNFVWNSSILYNADKSIVIAAANDVQGQKLPASVTTIYDYAFSAITNNITISADQSGIQYDENYQSNNVTFDFPIAISETVTADGKGIKITGTINQENFNTIYSNASYKNYNYLDFSEATIKGTIKVDNLSEDINRLYYFPSTANIDYSIAKNVVVGTSCSQLSLKDGKSFYNAKQFTAENGASLNRQMTQSKWGTIVVPFTVQLDLNNYWIGEFSNYNESTNTLTFSKVSTINANTPYVIKVLENGSTEPFTTGSSIIPATTAYNGIFRGSYEQITLGATYDYGYSTNGTFIKCNGTNVLKPFRAYFHIGDNNNAPKIRYVNEFEQEEYFEETAISEISEDNAANIIYNTNGQRVANMKNAGVYVSNGKKVIVK